MCPPSPDGTQKGYVMETKKLHLRVATRKKMKYDRDADMVIMRCITGDMGILPGHEPCSAILDDGVLRIRDGDDERKMAIFGGVMQVKDDVVTVLANEAQWPEDIDLSRAQAEHEELATRIQGGSGAVDIQKEQVKLRRTLVQMEVSAYPLISRG